MLAGMALVILVLVACVGKPANVKPVENFKVDRYLGTWYEIARLDHSFEQGLTKVTAQYSLRKDGGLRVVNRGYLGEKNTWKESIGKAYFVAGEDQGYLKVSFFGPFYGSYIIFELDHEGYQYAMVSGPQKSFLWLLSRTPTLNEDTKNRLIARAAELGFDTSKLIHVDQQ
ncbi:MAG: lipocalin family protein [Pseudomonadota bacterium]